MAELTHPPFLPAASCSQPNRTALLHLRRDQLVPVHLQSSSSNTEEATGYAEGHVTNTRFGSYPHSTLLDVLWGSQVRASIVDTGRRGQKKRQKVLHNTQDVARPTTPPVQLETEDDANTLSPRKRAAVEPAPLQPPAKKQQTNQSTPTQASSGFAHLLPLTPEGWTVSLPHRTQVVYTPDYSYVLQRLRIRPGSRVIEAGAGSGSFTHAAARAVYNGQTGDVAGSVFSYEYHKPRAEQLKIEVEEHGLSGLVQVTERDVCKDGFMLKNPRIPPDPPTPVKSETQDDIKFKTSSDLTTSHPTSPHATAIFLDLPTPSHVLPHLTPPTPSYPSPLHPSLPTHLCAFLPCIEQVQSFITALRAHSFVEIHMCELAHRRLEVRRERVGLDLEGLRGVNATARNVAEAVKRLKEVQARDREFREREREKEGKGRGDVQRGAKVEVEEGESRVEDKVTGKVEDDDNIREPAETRASRLDRIKEAQKEKRPWKEGRLVCRMEPEIKSHTSYLVFAILPRRWTEEDEAAAREQWKTGVVLEDGKRESKKKKKGGNGVSRAGEGGVKKEGDEEADVRVKQGTADENPERDE